MQDDCNIVSVGIVLVGIRFSTYLLFFTSNVLSMPSPVDKSSSVMIVYCQSSLPHQVSLGDSGCQHAVQYAGIEGSTCHAVVP